MGRCRPGVLALIECQTLGCGSVSSARGIGTPARWTGVPDTPERLRRARSASGRGVHGGCRLGIATSNSLDRDGLKAAAVKHRASAMPAEWGSAAIK